MAFPLQSPPFGIRTVLLAVAAFLMGLGALTLLLTRKPPPPAFVPAPSASVAVPWPSGFVEWEAVAPKGTSAPSAVPSAVTSASRE